MSFLTVLPFIAEENGYFKVSTAFGERFVKLTDAVPVREQKGTAEDIIQTGRFFLDFPTSGEGSAGLGSIAQGLCTVYLRPMDTVSP